MRFYSMFICLLLVSSQVFSQDFAPKLKFGKVPPEQMMMQEYEKDPEACAVVLADVGEIALSKDASQVFIVYRKHYRVKILDESCEGEGDVKIPYYSKDNIEEIVDLDAHTILPGGKTVKVEKKQIFKEKINDYWSSRNFSFPQVRPGCILEYKVTIRSLDYTDFPEWSFQGHLPRIVSAVKAEIPDWAQIEYLMQLSEPMVESKLKNGTSVHKGINSTLYIQRDGWYVMEDVEKLKEEPFVKSMDNHRAHMRYQLSELRINNQIYTYLDNWHTVNNRLQAASFFGQQYNNKSNFKKVLKELEPSYENISDPYEKAKAIYYSVVDNVEWNGKFRIGATDDLNDAFEKKEGSSADINLLILALMKEQGLNANPVLISTRNHGNFYKHIPLADQFNHVIVYLNVNGKAYFLDGLEPFIPFGFVHWQSLNGSGLLMLDNQINWVEPKEVLSKDALFFQYEFDEEWRMNGVIKGKYSNYSAYGERGFYLDAQNDKGKWENRLKETIDEFQIDSVTYEKLNQPEEDFEELIFFKGNGIVQDIGDMVYIQPVFYSNFMENPMKSETRTLPINFGFPFTEQLIFQVKIPEGYEIVQIPKQSHLQLQDKSAMLSYLCTEQLNSIMIKVDFLIKKSEYHATKYADLRKLFSELEEKLQEQIVLRKVEDDDE